MRIINKRERRDGRPMLDWKDAATAYKWFKAGKDTYQIAEALGVTEASVYNGIRAIRERLDRG